jgi:hypothetical protein
MTREERAEELNAMRQTHPDQLIGAYRAATNTPRLDQLPRGLGFTGMIEAILKHEFEVDGSHCQLQEATYAPTHDANCQPIAIESFEWDKRLSGRACMVEFRAFCSGAAMVFTGLLMAAIYLLMKHQIVI